MVDLYRGLLKGDDALVVHAYETWGFKRLTRELIDALNIWARFIYGPLLDDRVRTIADGVKPSQYGRKEAFRVHQALKKLGSVTVPREFVFMDRAAIGLGAVFLHLAAELNFYRLFNEAIDRFSVREVAARQTAALDKVGLKPSTGLSPAGVALGRLNCANPSAARTFGDLPPWPTTAPSNTPPRPGTTIPRMKTPTSASFSSPSWASFM